MAKQAGKRIAPPKAAGRRGNYVELERRFCEALVTDPDANATTAAVAVGYAPRNAKTQAAELLTRPRVQAYLAELRAARAQRTGIDADYVVGKLHRVIERSTADDTWDGATAVRACKTLGEHLGMFATKDGGTTNVQVNVQVLRFGDREIAF